MSRRGARDEVVREHQGRGVRFRIGSRGLTRPIVGRRVTVSTVVREKCRSFAPVVEASQGEAEREASLLGWVDVSGGFGTCSTCQGRAVETKERNDR